MCGGHWAVAGEVLGILFINFADNGFGDFDRFVVSLCFVRFLGLLSLIVFACSLFALSLFSFPCRGR